MNYAISDIHGRYDKYLKIIELIELCEDDMLYILGDVIDRGADGIKILLDIIGRENVKLIMGNHEKLFLSCLPFLIDDPEKISVPNLSPEQKADLVLWLLNGGVHTLEGLKETTEEQRRTIFDYLKNAEYYKELSAGEENYILCHAVIENFEEGKPLSEYDPDDFLHGRPGEDIELGDKIMVCGHTPVQYLNGSNRMSARGNVLDIDCGCALGDGRLGCVCLDTLEQYYV